MYPIVIYAMIGLDIDPKHIMFLLGYAKYDYTAT